MSIDHKIKTIVQVCTSQDRPFIYAIAMMNGDVYAPYGLYLLYKEKIPRFMTVFLDPPYYLHFRTLLAEVDSVRKISNTLYVGHLSEASQKKLSAMFIGQKRIEYIVTNGELTAFLSEDSVIFIDYLIKEKGIKDLKIIARNDQPGFSFVLYSKRQNTFYLFYDSGEYNVDESCSTLKSFHTVGTVKSTVVTAINFSKNPPTATLYRISKKHIEYCGKNQRVATLHTILQPFVSQKKAQKSLLISAVDIIIPTDTLVRVDKNDQIHIIKKKKPQKRKHPIKFMKKPKSVLPIKGMIYVDYDEENAVFNTIIRVNTCYYLVKLSPSAYSVLSSKQNIQSYVQKHGVLLPIKNENNNLFFSLPCTKKHNKNDSLVHHKKWKKKFRNLQYALSHGETVFPLLRQDLINDRSTYVSPLLYSFDSDNENSKIARYYSILESLISKARSIEHMMKKYQKFGHNIKYVPIELSYFALIDTGDYYVIPGTFSYEVRSTFFDENRHVGVKKSHVHFSTPIDSTALDIDSSKVVIIPKKITKTPIGIVASAHDAQISQVFPVRPDVFERLKKQSIELPSGLEYLELTVQDNEVTNTRLIKIRQSVNDPYSTDFLIKAYPSQNMIQVYYSINIIPIAPLYYFRYPPGYTIRRFIREDSPTVIFQVPDGREVGVAVFVFDIHVYLYHSPSYFIYEDDLSNGIFMKDFHDELDAFRILYARLKTRYVFEKEE